MRRLRAALPLRPAREEAKGLAARRSLPVRNSSNHPGETRCLKRRWKLKSRQQAPLQYGQSISCTLTTSSSPSATSAMCK